MNKREIMKLLKEFSTHQGFYKRLYDDVMKMDPALRDSWLEQFKNCKDGIDLIMRFEM